VVRSPPPFTPKLWSWETRDPLAYGRNTSTSMFQTRPASPANSRVAETKESTNDPLREAVADVHRHLTLLPPITLAMATPSTPLAVPGMSNPSFLRWLIHNNHLYLPTSTFDHEQSLLQEATCSGLRCARGTRCVARMVQPVEKGPGPASHIILPYMTPPEYAAWRGTKTLPRVVRPCVLCLREITCATIGLLHHMDHTIAVPDDVILQSFRNLFGTRGEYATDCSIAALGRVKLVFPYAVVCFQPRYLCWERTQDGVWIISQRRLLHAQQETLSARTMRSKESVL
jgi:hypothetical protein